MNQEASSPSRSTQPFELTGGALCLDFANTLGDRPRSENEHLKSYVDLLRFSRETDSLPEEDLDVLEDLLRSCEGCVEPIFEKAIELRESLYCIFSGVARKESPSEADLAVLNRALHKGLRQLELTPALTWSWGGSERALDRPLWPIARSAAELLTSGETDRIRECDAETCSWLFIDRSRNRCRRWCDMSTCGNRAKARRHYRRSKRKS